MRSIATAPPREMAAPVEPGPRTYGRSSVRVALVALLIGLITFLLIQSALAAHNAGVAREAIRRGWLSSPFERATLGARLPISLLYGSVAYLVLSIAGAAIAGRGHRLLFTLPASTLVFVSVLPSPHQPHAIGLEWAIQCYAPDTCSWPWFAHPWAGASVDLVLMLIPGAAVARSVPARRWPGSADPPAVAAILTAIAMAGTAWWALAAIEPYVDPAMLGTVAVFGLALGVARPWWPWMHVVFAAFATAFLSMMLDFLLWPDPGYAFADALPYALEALWPVVAVGLIASAWQPLAWTLRKLEERPLRLVIAVNTLNVVDAVMTFFAVRSGGAYESNPVIRLVGLPAKIVLVGTLTWLLNRRKPSALVWPAAALLWVAGYHVAGIIVNGWR